MGRGDDGKLHEQPEKAGNGLHFNAHVGVLKSQNNTSTGSSESHSNPAFLADRSLVIFNRSNHVLMERIGTELLEQLKADSHFDRVAYYPAGQLPEAGAEAPDLWLSINLDSIAESGIVELVAGAEPPNVEISANTAASFFVANDSEGYTVITVRVQTEGRGQPNAPATVILLQASENSRSWSTQSAFEGTSKLQHRFAVGTKPISVSLEKLDSDLFRVTAMLEN
jgi:hypothetical protein